MRPAVVACSLLLASTLAAHGGVYRGPGAVAPGGLGPGPVDDLTQWQFWWEFRKGSLLADALRRRGRIPPALPERTISEEIVPALVAALEDPTTNRDVRSACLLALAKTGARKELLPRARAMSMSSNQEVRETAILSLGVAAIVEAVPELLEVATDSEKARRELGAKGPIDHRRRAFACYALGLSALRTTHPGVKRSIFLRMRWILTEQTDAAPGVQAAALHAIRLLRPDAKTDAGRRLRQRATSFLLGIVNEEERPAQVRAHAWTALAELAERGDAKVLAALVKAMRTRQRSWRNQSATLGLGRMGRPEDRSACAALRQQFTKGGDEQSRHFAAIALGRIGGRANCAWLRGQLAERKMPPFRKPWLALGLALAARDETLPSAERKAIGKAIRQQLEAVKNPILAAGFALALAILGEQGATGVVRSRFQVSQGRDQVAGYLAMALALLGDEAASGMVRRLVDKGRRRPMLLTQCYPALAVIGGEESRKALLAVLTNPGTVSMFAAAARGLGLLRDPASVPPLIALLHKRRANALSRAFAAAALGELCRADLEPWSSPILAGFNYRASFETQTSVASNGILDLL